MRGQLPCGIFINQLTRGVLRTLVNIRVTFQQGGGKISPVCCVKAVNTTLKDKAAIANQDCTINLTWLLRCSRPNKKFHLLPRTRYLIQKLYPNTTFLGFFEVYFSFPSVFQTIFRSNRLKLKHIEREKIPLPTLIQY